MKVIVSSDEWYPVYSAKPFHPKDEVEEDEEDFLEIDDDLVNRFLKAEREFNEAHTEYVKAVEEAEEAKKHKEAWLKHIEQIKKQIAPRTIDEAYPICCGRRH